MHDAFESIGVGNILLVLTLIILILLLLVVLLLLVDKCLFKLHLLLHFLLLIGQYRMLTRLLLLWLLCLQAIRNIHTHRFLVLDWGSLHRVGIRS
jgi:hypothetical protein